MSGGDTQSGGGNGQAPEHVTRAEHDALTASVDELHGKLDFVVEQVKLIGSAMELLLKSKGLDDEH